MERIKELTKNWNTESRAHIVPSKGKFCVKKQGAKRAMKIFDFSEQAFYFAKLRFKNVVVHDKNGSVLFIDYGDN